MSSTGNDDPTIFLPDEGDDAGTPGRDAGRASPGSDAATFDAAGGEDLGDEFLGETLSAATIGDTEMPESGPPDSTGDARTLVYGGASVGPGKSGDAGAGAKNEVFAGRFEVIDLIGQGGMGKVFRVRDRQIEGREVALKILRPRFSRNKRFRSLFFQEIHAAQRFVSEYVVQVRDTGQLEDGLLFLTMDLVAGQPLSEALRREGSLNPRHALEVARQMLLALQSGHEQGFIHRDVKPPNVMLAARTSKTEDNPYGVGVRLLDFGIAGLAAEVEEGHVAGTLTYMSPEQVQGQRLDARTDLFAVGVCLFEMISGRRPFEGSTIEEIQTAVLETNVDPLIEELGGLPTSVQKILRKALQKDRDKRFASASDFIAAIEKSRAFRPAAGLPAWTGALLGTVTLVAVGECALIWQQRTQLENLRDNQATNVDKKQDEVRRAVAQAVSAKDKEYGVALTAQTSDYNQRLQQQSDEIQRLQVLVEERERTISEATSKLSDWGDADARLKAENDRIAAELAKLTREYNETRKQVIELQAIDDQRNYAETPKVMAANCFDQLSEFIEQGAGHAALRHFTTRRDDKSVFAIPHQDGSVLIQSLVSAASALEAARVEQGTGLAAARENLATVRREMTSFELEARSWLEIPFDEEEGVVKVARMDRLKAMVVAMEEELARLTGQIEAVRAAELDEITNGADDQDPEVAVAYAARYGAESVRGLLERFGSSLEVRAVVDGRLSLKTLQDSAALDTWSDWLAGPGAALAGPDIDRVRRFNAARRWWIHGEVTPDARRLFSASPVLSGAGPLADWQARIALQLALYKSDRFPLSSGGQNVMVNRWSSGSTIWFSDKLLSRTATTWDVERRVYKENGDDTGTRQNFTITRTGNAFFNAGRKILDLQDSTDSTLLANWAVEPIRPPSQPWSRDLGFDRFQTDAAAEPVPCLVVQYEETEYWISPRYGLVREVRSGKYTRNLVFGSASQ